MRTLLSLLFFAISGLSALGEVVHKLPDEEDKVLREATEVTLYSLEPSVRIRTEKFEFCGFTVLGKVTLDGETAKKVGTEFADAAVVANGLVAGCFNPRHGLEIKSNGHQYDFVLCYECCQIQVFKDNVFVASMLAQGSPKLLNLMLQDAKVVLPLPSEWEVNSDKDLVDRFKKAAPASIQDEVEQMFQGQRPMFSYQKQVDQMIKKLQAAEPDSATRVLKLLEWYGSSGAPWNGVRMEFLVPGEMLKTIPAEDIVNAVVGAPTLNDAQLEGIAHYFSDVSLKREEIDLLPKALREKLLDRIMNQEDGDDDKKSRALASLAPAGSISQASADYFWRYSRTFNDTSPLPKEVQDALSQTPALVVHSLAPFSAAKDKAYLGWRELGNMVYNGDRAQLITAAIQAAVDEASREKKNIGPCFYPAFAVSFDFQGHHYDLLLSCAPDGQMEIRKDEAFNVFVAISDAEAIFRDLLAADGVGLANLGESELLEKRKLDKQAWLMAAPEPIRVQIPGILAHYYSEGFKTRDQQEAQKALQQATPDSGKQVLQLLQWYGTDSGSWIAYPPYEDIPLTLLRLYTLTDVATAAQSDPLTNEQKEGLARYLAAFRDQPRSPQIDTISKTMKDGLRQFILNGHGSFATKSRAEFALE
jgi:hypothetical protein